MEDEKRKEGDGEDGGRKKSFDVPVSVFSRSRKSLDNIGSVPVSSNSTTSPPRAIEKKNLHQGMVGLDMTPFHQWDGYLEKQGAMIGGGRRRYFILVNSFITYYADLTAFRGQKYGSSESDSGIEIDS